MRIVLFTRKLDPGGAERQLALLAKGLKKEGHETHILLFYSGGHFDSELSSHGIKIHYLEKKHRWDIIGFFLRLTSALQYIKPDIIYSFLDLPNILAILFKRFAGRPKIIWGIRAAGTEMTNYDWLMQIIPWIESKLAHKPHTIIANSKAGQQWAINRKFPFNKLHVIENGIEKEKFYFNAHERRLFRDHWVIDEQKILIGLVGRLDPVKDHKTFLFACEHLIKNNHNIHIICTGTGSTKYAKEVKQLANKLCIDKHITFTGVIENMRPCYSAIDILVSSSYGEGFSNVIVESMACETPCVVTDVGDSARIVTNLGEVVPPKNSEALALGIERMLNRLNKEADLQKKVRARVIHEFSAERMVQRSLSLILSNEKLLN